jgi:hypothetical protein
MRCADSKAAEGRRTPRRWRVGQDPREREASWSAPGLWRFGTSSVWPTNVRIPNFTGGRPLRVLVCLLFVFVNWRGSSTFVMGKAKAVGPQKSRTRLGRWRPPPPSSWPSPSGRNACCGRRVTRKRLSPIPSQVCLPSGERVSLSPREGRGEGEGRMADQVARDDRAMIKLACFLVGFPVK